MMNTRDLTKAALLTATSLIMFVIESQIPPIVPIPGVKLGLANVITVYAMFALGPKSTLAILLCRIILGNIFAGQMVSFMYSLMGGLSCYAVMLIMSKIVTQKQIWICSVIGAIFHNIGQIAVAIFLTGTWTIIGYFPILMVSGIVGGCVTGLCAQYVVLRLKKQ